MLNYAGTQAMQAPMHFCDIRAQETHIVTAIFGYLRLQKKWNSVVIMKKSQ